MNILLIGSGAREHALARAIDRSSNDNNLYCVASNMNPGIAQICTEIVVDNINDPNIILGYAKQFRSSMVIIGPENPLENGVSDLLNNSGIKVVGPNRRLAQIETSKSFARDLLKEHGVPGGPRYKTFDSMKNVESFLLELGDRFVVKYDGLAGGKGVKVSGDHLHSKEDALSYCKELVNAGKEFVIEEKFIGEEFSLMSFCDGNTLQHMPAVQDHKRAHENDMGPNTGGMGTYSDADHSLPFLDENDIKEAQNINLKTADALKNKFGEGYKGVLYGGFMATADGVKLIEYNARLGDPEAMNVLSLLESDIVEICDAIATETLENVKVKFKNKATVCKYAVPDGYPENPLKGEVIDISAVADPETLFLASVDIKNGNLVEAGSRTVAIVGVAESITEAEKIAEAEILKVTGPLFHRKDIGTDEIVKKRIDHMASLR